MTGSLHKGGEVGVSQIMTVDDRGEGGGLAYLVRPDDVISGQPLGLSCRKTDGMMKEKSRPQSVSTEVTAGL